MSPESRFFSDLNNVSVYSILRPEFHDKFGFTEAEVARMSHDFGDENDQSFAEWYNGYMFGDNLIYNPWSILNYFDSADKIFRPYWVNTSSNDLVRQLVVDGDTGMQQKLEILLSGEVIRCRLNDAINLRDLEKNEETILNLLVFSGYLKPVRRIADSWRQQYELAIANREVHLFFEDSVRQWIGRQAGDEKIRAMIHCLLLGDIMVFGKRLSEVVVSVLSYHDVAGNEPERVYHAFVLGLLVYLTDRYTIRSNRESGYGRYDMMMIPKSVDDPGYVFEFKKVDENDDKTASTAMTSALRQIREREYADELGQEGVSRILGIGVVIEGKRVWVESVDLGNPGNLPETKGRQPGQLLL